MSKLEVNAVEPQCGTNLTLGASGDTIIIPSGATISNQGTAAGFGPTGAVSWDTTKKTTGFTAVSGVGYFCDTTSAAFTVTLPATPSAGAVVGLCDYANTFATNNLTVNRNGSKIAGSTLNSVLSTNGISVTFVYVDATQGWIVTDSGNRSDLPTPQYIVATGGTITTAPCGNFKVHTFTGPGTFTVCSVGNPAGSTTVDYLVIAGGGAAQDGGGGAGGYRTNYPSPTTAGLPVTAQGYPITVGAGGGVSPVAANGNSSIFSTITSAGGGRSLGGSGGAAGGSGGGAGGNGTGGAGNTPPVSPPQGNSGGTTSGPIAAGSGGGGSGGAGGNAPGPRAGGAGTTNSISGSSVAYASGGGGGGCSSPGGFSPIPATPGGGGQGIANTSGTPTPAASTAGTANTGGGGGGAWWGVNGSGGSGIVIIRYKFQ